MSLSVSESVCIYVCIRELHKVHVNVCACVSARPVTAVVEHSLLKERRYVAHGVF